MKINFQFETQYGKFSDALYLPDDHAFTEAEIEAMKQERLNAWINFIENPPPNSNPIPEEEIIEEQVQE